MAKILSNFEFGDMSVYYILNDFNRATLVFLPKVKECDLLSQKNCEVYNKSSLAHIHLSEYNEGIFSNSFKLSEAVLMLKYVSQSVIEDADSVKVITTEQSSDGWGIVHTLTWLRDNDGFDIQTEFFNNSDREVTLEYITSAALDALSPYLDTAGSNDLLFHRFKAGWCMEGMHQVSTVSEMGLERTWTTSGESVKLSAVGSRPIREYHPYSAVEDSRSGVIWGVYLSHNASWQIELTRLNNGLMLSAGLADSVTGLWSKVIKQGERFMSPKATVSVCEGSIAELSNRLLSIRRKEIEKIGEKELYITYNDFVTTWGCPTEEGLLKVANILKQGKTKYFVMDAGWSYSHLYNIVNNEAFPNGMRAYSDKIREMGMIPGIWLEFENVDSNTDFYNQDIDDLMLKCHGRTIIGHIINDRRVKFFDFKNPDAIALLDKKVIDFLNEGGFGYVKVDYNASTGAVIDGKESGGENLRQQMELVREYFKKMKREVPGLVIENCASGGCRLEPSMMDFTEISSASDTHEGYEGAVVAANLHYLTPARQNLIWCTLHPEYTSEHFSFIISQGFLGRICWSGNIVGMSAKQHSEMFAAEDFYYEVSEIIDKGNSYIYRTQKTAFLSQQGTQAVVRYSLDKKRALVVAHGFENAECLEIKLCGNYKIEKSLYESNAELIGDTLKLNPVDYSGNVYLLTAE